METNYTSIDQARHLLKLGLNPNTADMRYEYNNMIGDYEPIPKIGAPRYDEPSAVPCWSFGRLIEIMPKYMKSGKDYFELMVIPFYFSVRYYNESTKTYMESKMGSTLMDAAVKMAERLLECKSTYLADNSNKMLAQ